MKRGVRMLALFGALAAIGMAGSAQAQAPAQAPQKRVRIGMLADFTTQYAVYGGKFSLLATRMAIEDFQAANPGWNVDLVYADHQSKPDVGSGIVRRWMDEGAVDVVSSLPTSNVALAAMQITGERGRIALVNSAMTSRIVNEDCNATTTLWPYNTQVFGDSSTRALVAQGDDSFYFITADNDGGNSSQRDTTETIGKAGGKVVGSVRHPFGAPDFSSYLLQAQSSGSKVIALANAGLDTVNTMRAAREFGIKQKLLGLAFSITGVHAAGLDVAQGLLFADGFYWDLDDETRAFSRRFFAANGNVQMPSTSIGAEYSAVLHYLKAVAAVGSTEAAPVMAKMRETPVRDAYVHAGTVRADGQMVHDFYLFQVKSPSESKYAWDYLKVLRTIPAAEAYRPLSESRCKLVKQG